MKNAEEATEKVLAALRDVRPPAHMQDRILQALAGRQLALPSPRWGLAWLPRLRPLGRALVVCSGMAVILLLFVRPIPTTHLRRRNVERSMGPSMPHAGTPQPSGDGVAIPARRSLEPVKHRGRVELVIREDGKTAEMARAARRDVLAVSSPAPPMPLTEQERLLLRLAHKSDPVELAMLNPQKQALLEAERKAEFQKFFNPVEVVENR